jgi:hypothetical protein
VDLWSFVEIFSKKLETQNIQIGSSIVTLLKDFRSQFYFRFIIKKMQFYDDPRRTQVRYRLIDLENAEIGRRCISTGPSPLDLGIGAMA